MNKNNFIIGKMVEIQHYNFCQQNNAFSICGIKIAISNVKVIIL